MSSPTELVYPPPFWSIAASQDVRTDNITAELSAMQINSWRAACEEVTWRVSVPRIPEERLGARVHRIQERGRLLIGMILQDGQTAAWNQRNPAQQLKEGDHILEINGVTGDMEAMENLLQSSSVGTLNMLIARVIEFPTELDLGLGSHGLELDTNMFVMDILPDSVADMMNKKLPFDLRIRRGDHLVAVNCQRSKAAMESHLSSNAASFLDLTFQRSAPNAWPFLMDPPAAAVASNRCKKTKRRICCPGISTVCAKGARFLQSIANVNAKRERRQKSGALVQ